MISSDRIKSNKRDKKENFPPFLLLYLSLQLAVFLELCALSETVWLSELIMYADKYSSILILRDIPTSFFTDFSLSNGSG